ncbi:hypothetical protein AAVH_25342 [Aphelenchoides avenae]|nr:hypothetical protein AAVH_25342 [Aphelenchus avenae]
MSLPAEVLLDVVQCVDYNTLVALCSTSHSFFGVVQNNAHALAKRHCWDVSVSNNDVKLWERLDKLAEWRFHSKKPLTYVYALKRLASFVGFHQLKELSGPQDMPVEAVLEAAPALRFVERLHLWSTDKITQSGAVPAAADVELSVSRFANFRELSLYLPGPFDWGAFLLSESALKLPELTFDYYSVPKESDLLRYCLDSLIYRPTWDVASPLGASSLLATSRWNACVYVPAN